MQSPIIMIGCGNMGQAMLRRFLDIGTSNNFYVVKPTALPDDLRSSDAIFWVDSIAKLPDNINPAAIILAVKPQIMHEILPQLHEFVADDVLICSIAAGLNLEFYSNILGAKSIIRLMPNTPVKIGEGVISLHANQHVSDVQKLFTTQLFASFGELIWLESEHLMNLATAISGSGCAYFYLFMEELAAAAEKLGLTSEIARKMVVQTARGATGMALNAPEKTFTNLRAEVTSKGGTTEAALQQFEKNNQLQQLIFSAVNSAMARANQLNCEKTIT